MQTQRRLFSYGILLLVTLSLAFTVAAPAQTPVASAAPAHTPSASFVVFDNMYYKGRPEGTPAGMMPINLIYERDIWPNGASESVMPARKDFDALVKKASKPGPLVLDIEKLGLTTAENELELATLADWVHEDLPGEIVGYYGYNTLTKVKPENVAYARQLATHLDAMFPSMYSFNKDQTAWAELAAKEAAEARLLAPGKPVYFYLQPQYHHTTPLAYQYVEADYWAFQLNTSRQIADGVVIWTGSRWPWDDSAGWWKSTQAFLTTCCQTQKK